MARDTRQLVLVALALLVVLLVGRTLVGAFFDAEGVRTRVLGLQRSLTGDGGSQPPAPAAREAEAWVADLEDRLERAVPALAYERPAAFDVPPGESPDLRYIEVLRREQETLVQGARFVGRAVPLDLGMPVPNPTGLEDVLAALRALHVVHVVVGAALEAGVDAVDAISLPATSRRRAAESGFVKTWPVEFELHGPPRAIRDTLAAVAGGTPYLALDEVSLASLDEDGEQVRCRFRAAVVTVDVEAPAQPERAPR